MTLILIPDKRIMEEIIDSPLESIGVKAFDSIIELKSFCGCQIVIPSQMKRRLDKRLKDDHKAAIYSHIDLDYSTEGLNGYDSYTSYQYLVPKKAINPKDYVIFVAHDVNMYNISIANNIIQITSSAFVDRIKFLLSITKKINLDFYDEIVLKILKSGF